MTLRMLIVALLLATSAHAQSAAPHERLREILSRREFRALPREGQAPDIALPRPHAPSFFAWLGDRLATFFGQLWDWLKRYFEGGDDTRSELPSGFGFASLSQPATLALAAGAAALLGVVLWRLIKQRRGAPSAAPDVSPAVGEGMPDALQRPADAWARFAEDFRRRGEWRLALRALYLRLLVLLHERGAIHYERQKTNGEYARALRDGPAGPSFADLTAAFDRAWYGNKPLAEADYEMALGFARSVDQATAPS